MSLIGTMANLRRSHPDRPPASSNPHWIGGSDCQVAVWDYV